MSDWPAVHYRQFSPEKLILRLSEATMRWPNCTLSRSGNGIGDICIYDRDGEYVGVVELTDPPELIVIPDS